MNDAINLLCEKLGVTAEYLIPRTISYLQTNSIIRLVILLVITLALAIGVSIPAIKWFKDPATVYDDMYGFLIMLLGVGLIAAIIFLLVAIYEVVISFGSPEMHAITYLIGKIK